MDLIIQHYDFIIPSGRGGKQLTQDEDVGENMRSATFHSTALYTKIILTISNLVIPKLNVQVDNIELNTQTGSKYELQLGKCCKSTPRNEWGWSTTFHDKNLLVALLSSGSDSFPTPSCVVCLLL